MSEASTASTKKRVQLSAPVDLVDAWERRAAELGVSLNAWIIAQVMRPDTEVSLSRIASVMEKMAAAIREHE